MKQTQFIINTTQNYKQYASTDILRMDSLLISSHIFYSIGCTHLKRSSFFPVQCCYVIFFTVVFFLHRLKSSFFPVGHKQLSGMLSMVSSNTIDVVCTITNTSHNE